jgi:aminoglycoside phosphotransferase (APT) family kinase protein
MIDQPVPIRPGEQLDLDKLSTFLSEKLGIPFTKLEVRQFASGYSNLTYLIEMGDLEMILRRPPSGVSIKSGHDMAREFKILSALSTSYHKVPEPLIFCDDDSILGVPFYLMERIKGVILRATIQPDRHPNQTTMQGISKAFVDTLVELHQIDYRQVGLQDLGKPNGYVARQVAGWAKRYDQSKTEEIVAINRTIAWLSNQVPAESGSALIHNDFKYDNLILDAADLTKVLAVLDWEMSTLGDPLMDLGTSLGYWVNPNDPDWMQRLALSPTLIPGNPSRAEVAQEYALKSGMDLGEIIFYYVYGLFKISVITQQIYYRYKKGYTQDSRFASLIEVVKGLSTMATLAIEKRRIDDLF